MTTVLRGFQILPLGEHTLVGFHLWTRLCPFEVITLEPADQVVEDQGIGSLATVFGRHADQQQIHNGGLMLLQDLQQMPPAEGEKIFCRAREKEGNVMPKPTILSPSMTAVTRFRSAILI